MVIGETEYIDQYEAASLLNVQRSTLQRWHREEDGPPRHKIGRNWWYIAAEIDTWTKGR